MNAERTNNSSDAEVVNLSGFRREKEGKLNPLNADLHEVIAWFLVEAEVRRVGSTDYIHRILGRSGEASGELETLLRQRLLELANKSNEDDIEDDNIVAEIYSELRSTKDRAGDSSQYRQALRELLPLRAAEIEQSSEEDVNSNRWTRLIRKLGKNSINR